MFELFMEKSKADGITISSKNFPTIRSEFLKSLNRVLLHYRESSFFVNNDHLLVRILKSLPPPSGNDIRSWYYRIQDLSSGLGNIYEFISYQNSKARVHKNIFLGGVGEILVEYNLPITMNLKMEDWMNTSPITFLYHPYLELRTRPIDGENFDTPTRGDYAVIGLDIPLLYVQYWLWRKNIAPNKYPDGNYPTLTNWVYKYPLVTAVKSFLDISLINRYLEVIENKALPASKELSKLDTNYVDYTRTVDEFIIGQVKLLSTQQRTYPEILKNFPMLISDNAFERLRILPNQVTRQLRWCYLAARIDIISFLYSLTDMKNNNSDRYYEEKWKYGIRLIQSEYINTYPTTMGLSKKIKDLSEMMK